MTDPMLDPILDPALDPKNSGKIPVLVWDFPTRLFHWLLVVAFVVVWVSGEADGFLFQVHLYAGYVILGLVGFRIAWGVIGTRHAVFSSFVRSWGTVRDHALGLLRLAPPVTVGHNPLGGWMIVLLLVFLSLSVGTGLFSEDDGMGGPYARLLSPWAVDAISEVHEALANVVLFLIAIHVAGVVVDSFLTRENLIRAMLTGVKPLPTERADQGIEPVGYLRTVAGIFVAAVLVWLIVG